MRRWNLERITAEFGPGADLTSRCGAHWTFTKDLTGAVELNSAGQFSQEVEFG